ncbi:MAG TPA: cytochrome P450 [Candidatus Binatia bacterium]|jgi:cytochrome P450|nr:cytochrome P450 [Candidatus Binatia bacterium]
MELNPFAWEFHDDPYPTYRWLRDEAPIYRNEAMSFWALSRFRDVMAAFVDWQTYSSVGALVLEKLDPVFLEMAPIMILMDPPRHDRLRKLVSRAFTPRRVAEMEPFVRKLACDMLDPLVAQGGGDFVEDFSTPFPMDVIFTLLGVPEADRRMVRTWTDISLSRDPGTDAIPSRAKEAGALSLQYFFGLVQELRARPNDGLISGLFDVEIEEDGGTTSRLTDGEIVGFCSLLGAAGSETTTRLLGFAALLFARYPDQYATILADPSRIPDAVEEVLRWSSPAQYAVRNVMRDVEWYGQRIPQGDRIMLLAGSANRDEREYRDPDRFDVTRGIPTQLGFGQGVHFCIGASLARLESRIALEEFARRFPRYAIDESRCRRVHMSNVHGYESVPFVVA